MGIPPNIDGLLRGLELEFGRETWKLSSAGQDLQFDTTFGSIFHLEAILYWLKIYLVFLKNVSTFFN